MVTWLTVYRQLQVVRSTLLWPLPLAAPSGEIGGVPVTCTWVTFDQIFQYDKMEKGFATAVFYSSECVDSEFVSDSFISVCLMLIHSHFRSDMVDIGCQKCQDERERAFAVAGVIKYNPLSVLKTCMTLRKNHIFYVITMDITQTYHGRNIDSQKNHRYITSNIWIFEVSEMS